MNRFRLFAWLVAPALLVAAAKQQRGGVAITFLANEGVLLSAGDKSVLIDGLFRKYQTEYAVPTDSTRSALEGARPPFRGVDLLLVTHRHGDHFHPAPVIAHLRANPGSVLLTSAQVIDSLRGGDAAAASELQPRLIARTTAPGTRQRATANGVSIELLGLPHGGTRHRHVEHLAYLIDLGGRRVLHVGDADLTEAALSPFRLDTASIDVALVPYWAVTGRESRQAIDRWIRPRQVVAFHVEEGVEAERLSREVQSAIPGAIVFTRSLETRHW